ncbi:MAG: hypothetical protein KDA78_12545 [Planctomycetaceae bacterium]|nr:hypothetical protein [Planctomycetaceae bacterium]
MKQTFVITAIAVSAFWIGTQLYLSGYEQGYVAGEDSAWSRANQSLLTTRSNRPQINPASSALGPLQNSESSPLLK